MSSTASPGAPPRPSRPGLTFDPRDVQRHLAQGHPSRAVPLVLEALRHLHDGLEPTSETEDGIADAYTWWATQVARMLADPRTRFNREEYLRLAEHLPDLTDLFGVTAAGSPDEVTLAIAGQIADGGLTEANVARLLLSTSLHGEVDPGLEAMASVAPELVWPVWLGLLSTRNVVTPGARRRRRALHALAPTLADHPVGLEALDSLCRAWFLCSYDSAPDRHEIKRSLNRMVRGIVRRIGIDPDHAPRPPVSRQRPRLVVVAEAFSSGHAMYRCYAPRIRALGEHFELTLAADPRLIDDEVRRLVPHVIPVEISARGLRRGVAEVRRLAPDLVYHPSVGMSQLGVVLANVRLAPAHVASVGHPATTHAVDYVVFQERYAEAAACFSETVVVYASDTDMIARHPELDGLVSSPPTPGGPTRIAVPSSLWKLGPEFLSTCRRIGARTRGAVRFAFFPHVRGLAHRHAARRITEILPEAEVHPWMDYRSYMTALAACDLQLAPFPFGNTNGTIDALHLGIPTVTLEGTELHGRTDAVLLRRAGLPDWLVAATVDDYVAAAVSLVDDAPSRRQVQAALRRVDLATWESKGTGDSAAFVDAFADILQRSRGRPEGTGGRRVAFPATPSTCEP